MSAAGNGRLRARIEAEAREARVPLGAVTVLDKKVDPYRQDTPVGHRDGAWLAEQMANLEDRALEIENEWLAEAQAALEDEIDADLIAALHAEAEGKLAGVREEIERINEQLRASTENLGVELPPPPEPPEPELDEGGALPPLISSAWPWVEQTRALIARKRYGNRAATP